MGYAFKMPEWWPHIGRFLLRVYGVFGSNTGFVVFGALLSIISFLDSAYRKAEIESFQFRSKHLPRTRWQEARDWARAMMHQVIPVLTSLRGKLIIAAWVLFLGYSVAVAVWNDHSYLVAVNKRHRETIGALEKKVREFEADRRNPPSVPTAPRWVADLALSNGFNFTEIGTQQGTRMGVFLLITPRETIRPPHTVRFELDRPTRITGVHIDPEHAVDLKWSQVNQKYVEMRFSGPTMQAGLPFHVEIYVAKPEEQFSVVRVYRLQ